MHIVRAYTFTWTRWRDRPVNIHYARNLALQVGICSRVCCCHTCIFTSLSIVCLWYVCMCGHAINRAWYGSIAPEKPVNIPKRAISVRNRGMSCAEGIVCPKQEKHLKSKQMGWRMPALWRGLLQICSNLCYYIFVSWQHHIQPILSNSNIQFCPNRKGSRPS